MVGCSDLMVVRYPSSRVLRSRAFGSLPRSSSSPCAGTCGTGSPTATSRNSSPNAGLRVDHVTVYRWVQRFTPLLADAARPCRHAVGDRWFVDETYVKVAGRWRYVYRAIDQHGQIIDVYVSARRDIRAARRFFTTALGAHDEPTEVVTDRAWTLRAVIDELIPGAFHNTEQYANNRIETDHGRLKARVRPMRGLKRDHTARVIIRGHALMQNVRRGHYQLGIDARAHRRVAAAFTELARTI